MPRAKKDGEKISLYIDKETSERIRSYAEEKGQTLAMSIERAINGFLDSETEQNESNRGEEDDPV